MTKRLTTTFVLIMSTLLLNGGLGASGTSQAQPLAIAPSAPLATAPGWFVTTVDSAGDTGKYASLALDSQGFAHIAYFRFTNNSLWYARQVTRSDQIVWDHDEVDDTAWVGEYSSLALDAADNDRPYISYFDESSDNLKIAWLVGSTWYSDTIGNSSHSQGTFTSIAVNDGWYHITFFDATDSEIQYISGCKVKACAGLNTTIASFTGSEPRNAIALTSTGSPRVTYFDGGAFNLARTSTGGSIWNTQIIDSSPTVGQYSDIVIVGVFDHAYMSYMDGMTGAVRLATKSGIFPFSVTTQTLNSPDGPVHGSFTSIDMDPHGRLGISFYDSTPQALRFVSNESGEWRIETVDEGFWTGLYTSLAFDDFGRAHIAYYDYQTADLKYALRGSAVFLPLVIRA